MSSEGSDLKFHGDFGCLASMGPVQILGEGSVTTAESTEALPVGHLTTSLGCRKRLWPFWCLTRETNKSLETCRQETVGADLR
ncbi:hypothetical protein RUM43_009371, partial [Polyplax serrata]